MSGRTRIRTTALCYINKHVMNPSAWRATSVGEIHPKLTVLADLSTSELMRLRLANGRVVEWEYET